MLGWFANLRLQWKVLLAPAFLILVLICISLYSLQMQRASRAAADAVLVGPVQQSQIAADFAAAIWAAQSRLYRLTATAANETDEKKIKQVAAQTSAALEAVAQSLAAFDAIATDAHTNGIVGKLKGAFATYLKQAKSVADMADSDAGSALMFMMRAEKTFGEIEKLTDEIGERSKDLRDREIARADRAIGAQMTLLAIVALLAVLVGGLVSFFVGRKIAGPVMNVATAIEQIAQGDLNVEISHGDRRDEIGVISSAAVTLREAIREKQQAEAHAAREKERRELEAATQRESVEAEEKRRIEAQRRREYDEQTAAVEAVESGMERLAKGDLTYRIAIEVAPRYQTLKDNFNSALQELQNAIVGIVTSTREVSSAAAEISESTTDLSQRTEGQAAGLEETSASMEQMAATVKKNADNAQAANQSADGARAVADRGGQVVAEAVQAMARIEDSSRKIADIIGVIDEIARQTNLLALNAAVEAARAGEAGRGFAVVASEVRSLAQRASQAAKDIKDLITASNSQVKDGVSLVNRAGGSLAEIVQSIENVAAIVSGIASASAEQAIGIAEVNKALTQMDEATQQNSALVEQNAATAKILEQQARAMEEQTCAFEIGDQTASASASRRASSASLGQETSSKAAHQMTAPRVRRARAQGALALKDDAGWREF